MKNFLIIARPPAVEVERENGRVDLVPCQRQRVEVKARKWDDAYQELRDNGFTPFVDEYTPQPSRI